MTLAAEHGKGVKTWPTGNKYAGQYVEDKREGEGEMIYADGSIYRGGWRQGNFHGKGELVFKTDRVGGLSFSARCAPPPCQHECLARTNAGNAARNESNHSDAAPRLDGETGLSTWAGLAYTAMWTRRWTRGREVVRSL